MKGKREEEQERKNYGNVAVVAGLNELLVGANSSRKKKNQKSKIKKIGVCKFIAVYPRGLATVEFRINRL